ncbi:MAG: carbohydrate-binding family 9-like protein [Pyrinomonadaceae bacterium]|nr:carbohydrate-binding family 9-like protein [Pyrinomonadaceae bacterium]
MNNNFINVCYIADDVAIDDFTLEKWKTADVVEMRKYWSGINAPLERFSEARVLWNDAALFVRFDCEQHEHYVTNTMPHFDCKTERLWEQDVCEIFIAPNPKKPESYFEFEIAPTGEWLDLAILQLENRRETDFNYASGMKTSTNKRDNGFTAIFRVEWQAFGERPRSGDIWRGNFFRCVGAGANRGYLAWRPTFTATPNFHVPKVFGEFRFTIR